VKLLLDTHVFLWAASEPSKLSREARAAVMDGANDVYASPIVGWELAVKQSLGKLSLPSPAELWVPEVVRRTSYGTLPVSLEAALRVREGDRRRRGPTVPQAETAALVAENRRILSTRTA
jgi:PIN domain nuclease of toxin-antitoxin system